MVGGKVIEVADVPGSPGILFVDVADRGGGGRKNDTCAVLVERNPNSERIEIGDSLWWQSGNCYWTPQANVGPTCDHVHHYDCKRCGVDYDIKIPKVGYSGVTHLSRPAAATQE